MLQKGAVTRSGVNTFDLYSESECQESAVNEGICGEEIQIYPDLNVALQVSSQLYAPAFVLPGTSLRYRLNKKLFESRSGRFGEENGVRCSWELGAAIAQSVWRVGFGLEDPGTIFRFLARERDFLPDPAYQMDAVG